MCVQDIQKGIVFPSSRNSSALQGVLIACPTLVTSSPLQSKETAWNSSGKKSLCLSLKKELIKGLKLDKQPSTCEGMWWPRVHAVLFCSRLSQQRTLLPQSLWGKHG